MSDRSDGPQTKPTPLQSAIAGGISGLTARFCISPFDVVKITMQLQTDRLQGMQRARKGMLHHTKRIYKEYGIRGFWRGNVPAEWLYVSYNGSQFLTYNLMNQALAETDLYPKAQKFIAGAIAGAVATTVTYPFDLLRTRFAAQSKDKFYTSVIDSVRKIIKAEGSRGLYTGLGPAVGQILPASGIFFAGYETLRPVFKELNLPFSSADALTGATANSIAKIAIFPLDLIRKRLQVQGPARSKLAYGAIPEYQRGVFATGRAIVQSEGPRGLYRGLIIGVLKAAPASAVTMWIFEAVSYALVQKGLFTSLWE